MKWVNLEDIKVKLAQSFLTLCDSMDCRPPGSSAHGILQARTLEWVTISSSIEDIMLSEISWSHGQKNNYCLIPIQSDFKFKIINTVRL